VKRAFNFQRCLLAPQQVAAAKNTKLNGAVLTTSQTAAWVRMAQEAPKVSSPHPESESTEETLLERFASTRREEDRIIEEIDNGLELLGSLSSAMEPEARAEPGCCYQQ
jgi:hypothetical protein